MRHPAELADKVGSNRVKSLLERFRMPTRRLLLAHKFLGLGACYSLAAQDQSPQDPQMKQFEAVTTLLGQGRPVEAERILDQVQLRSNQSKFQLGRSTISAYAFSSTLLINTYLRLNDYSNAERVAKDRVTWAEQQYGGAAMQVGGFLSLLADIERLRGKYKDAEPNYVRALSIHRALNLANCLVAKGIYTGLAETYLAMKRPGDAQELLRPAIDTCREKFGEKGMGRSDLLNVYAVALENDEKPEQAATAASEADRVGTPDPRFQQEDRDLLRGRLLAAQRRFDDSVSYCRKWITIFEMPDGPDSDRRLMLPLGECERLLRSAGRTAEALQTGSRLNEIRTKYDVRF
jgi:tetratricopeptide (TPR) repeat protein